MAKPVVKAIPAKDFILKLVDLPKSKLSENMINAGFFGKYGSDSGDFTLPTAHLVADFEAKNPQTLRYCIERGKFDTDGVKFRHDSSKWKFMNEFHGKAISTLFVKDGHAWVADAVSLHECDYAVSGVPVMRNGEDCKYTPYVVGQGWDASSLYGTWHTFVGMKDDPSTVYVMGMKTTTSNLIKTSEAYKVFQSMGFRDVIKLDGGGSFYFNADNTIHSTGGSRIINSVITWKKNERTDGNMFKIALGAGHGANTPGKRCLKSLDPNETREWFLNDRIADKVEKALQSYEGYQLLRLDDSDDGEVNVELSERVNAANNWGADFYLSIHHNAGINGGIGGGIVAYTCKNSQAASKLWQSDLYDALIKHTGLKGNRTMPKAENDYYVLTKTKMPAVLLELGFMDSATDVPIILTEAFADKCAKAIVEVIVKRATLKYKGEAEEEQAIKWITENKIMLGNENGDLMLDEPLTRKQFAVMLHRYANK